MPKKSPELTIIEMNEPDFSVLPLEIAFILPCMAFMQPWLESSVLQAKEEAAARTDELMEVFARRVEAALTKRNETLFNLSEASQGFRAVAGG